MYDIQFKERDAEKPTLQGVGFFEGVEQVLPGGILLRAAQDTLKDEQVTSSYTEEVFLLQVIMKAIKEMSYIDYQALQPYLFHYETVQNVSCPLVRPLELTEEGFRLLQQDPEKYFMRPIEVRK